MFVSLTLMGMKGRTMAQASSDFPSGYTSEPFDRVVILCPDMLIENLTEGYPILPHFFPSLIRFGKPLAARKLHTSIVGMVFGRRP